MKSGAALLLTTAVVVAACSPPRAPAEVSAKPSAPFFAAGLRASIEARLAGVRAHASASDGGAVGAMVVGTYARGETAFFNAGARTPAPGAPAADGDTIFKVCSVTKVFTAVLLADAVMQGKIRLDDEAQSHLRRLKLPTHPGGPIRVEHLATYRAGFPWQPTNMVSKKDGGYSEAAWRSFVEGFSLPRAPGQEFEYGNVGFAVLGDLVADEAGMPLDEVFRRRLFTPLGMRRSGFLGAHALDPNVAQGFDEAGKPVPLDADEPSQAGACALETTGNDLLAFARAHLEDGPLAPAMRLALERRRPAGGAYAGNDVGLGWFLAPEDGIAWKSGAIGGYRSLLGLDLRARTAVVVLAADERFDSKLAFDAVLAELRRANEPTAPPRPVAIPPSAIAADALFDEGLRLVAVDAPAEVRLGERATVRYFYRVERTPVREWEVFVHADAPHERVRSDHVLDVPMRSLRPGDVVEDRVELVFRPDLQNRELVLWSGFFHGAARMDLEPKTPDRRFRGPTIRVAAPSQESR